MNLDDYRVPPPLAAALTSSGATARPPLDLDTWDADDVRAIGDDKREARDQLDALRQQLGKLQDKFYADRRHRLLIVLQAMDTAGKDSTIRHVFQTVDPIGVRVAAFGPPSTEEAARDYLWRIHSRVPGAGEIVIFNRSHYEDVLVTRVEGWIDDAECARRYRQINDFERLLVETGTTVLKFYLHISKDEQKKRLEERRDNPDKQWKFRPEDLVARTKWNDYRAAYTAALGATSTAHAPWYVVPANSKLARNLLVSRILVDTLEGMGLRYPEAAPGIAKSNLTNRI